MSLPQLFLLGTALWILSIGITDYRQHHIAWKSGK